MKEFASWVAGLLLVAICLIGAAWFVQGNNFFMYQYFAPKFEQVRRETFEQSKSYNQGIIQEIQNMQFEYEQTDETHKTALRSIILHRVADYDLSKLPQDTRIFIEQLKRGDK